MALESRLSLTLTFMGRIFRERRWGRARVCQSARRQLESCHGQTLATRALRRPDYAYATVDYWQRELSARSFNKGILLASINYTIREHPVYLFKDAQEWNGTERKTQTNGMEWSGVEWNAVQCRRIREKMASYFYVTCIILLQHVPSHEKGHLISFT